MLTIRFRERQQKRIKNYLQRELDKRTREVVIQRDQLERKNKDITDSINYAKCIQTAILPVPEEMDEALPGSFIFFRPRDIVSGDFYWFNTYSDKALIACADATGHGLPGAFMSIIGVTVLQDTLSLKEINSPSDVLFRLDREVRKLLSADKGDDNPRDGMDISICEVDLKSKEVRIASAMRPVIVFKDGEEMYLKGSRNPIGGGYSEEKDFSMTTLQLSSGDMVFMFSDGYPDQFGGPEGKKFKISRFREMLAFLHDKPKDIQQNTLASTLDKWMGETSQIDDIIIMGIRIP